MREILENLEEQLLSMEKKQRIMLYVMIPVLVLGMSWYFYIEPTQEQIESYNSELSSLERKIRKNAPRTFFVKIKKIRSEILQNKTDIEEAKQRLIAVGTKLDKMNFLFANQKGFNLFVEKMLRSSVKHNFLVESVEIDQEKKPFIGVIEKQKKIHLKGYGEFLDTVRFVRDLEKTRILMAVKDFSIETNGTIPSVELSIDFYGVKR